MPTTDLANGNPNSFFIAECRRILRDQPAWFTDAIPTDATNGIITAPGAKPFRLQRAPIVAAGATVAAPSPVNAGITSYRTAYDTAGPAPTVAVVLTTGGAGGGLAAGTYQYFYTYSYAGGESGPSPLSNALAVGANVLIAIGALAGIASTVTQLNFYLLPTTGAASPGGLAFTAVPVAGAFAGTSAGTVGITAGLFPVLIATDTGEIIFPAAPIAGTMSATYQSFRYSDTQVLDALTEGLRSLWPEIWQEKFDTSLTPTPYAFEYTLPAVFNDPRVTIIGLEVRDPNVIVIPYRWVDRYTRISQTILRLTDLLYSPAGNIRIHYNAPYLALSDTEPQVQHLPVYFALGRLLADQEAMRSRQDELVPLVGEGGSQSGIAQQTSSYWFSLYEREKARYARPLPTANTRSFEDWSYSVRVPWRTSA